MNVDLGFAEKQDSWLLTNRFFPSKIGGSVAWLELENIPETSDISCEYCNEPCLFLCQIYAPSEKNANGFHRTVYVFICKNGACCSINQSGNIKILRCQLPLKNKFYPDSPPNESIEADEIDPACKVCNVCGCQGSMVCGKCKKINYCGQLHQRMDWKSHKVVCGTGNEKKSSSSYFPEYEIVIEREEMNLTEKSSESDVESQRLREYEDMINKGLSVGAEDMTEKDLMDMAESKEDKTFGKFKKTTDQYPTQVIRYSRHGKPLWISDCVISNKDIPKCENCKGSRSFEFQVMPQMLNELKNYDLDWGIIAVFTCENDCDTNGKYVAEFCYKQDVTKSDDDPSKDVDMSKAKIGNVKDSIEEVKEKVTDNGAKKSNKKRSKQPNCAKKSFQESENWE